MLGPVVIPGSGGGSPGSGFPNPPGGASPGDLYILIVGDDGHYTVSALGADDLVPDGGTNGQVLVRGSDGTLTWTDMPADVHELPESGTPGWYLMLTADGPVWSAIDLSGFSARATALEDLTGDAEHGNAALDTRLAAAETSLTAAQEVVGSLGDAVGALQDLTGDETHGNIVLDTRVSAVEGELAAESTPAVTTSTAAIAGSDLLSAHFDLGDYSMTYEGDTGFDQFAPVFVYLPFTVDDAMTVADLFSAFNAAGASQGVEISIAAGVGQAVWTGGVYPEPYIANILWGTLSGKLSFEDSHGATAVQTLWTGDQSGDGAYTSSGNFVPSISAQVELGNTVYEGSSSDFVRSFRTLYTTTAVAGTLTLTMSGLDPLPVVITDGMDAGGVGSAITDAVTAAQGAGQDWQISAGLTNNVLRISTSNYVVADMLAAGPLNIGGDQDMLDSIGIDSGDHYLHVGSDTGLPARRVITDMDGVQIEMDRDGRAVRAFMDYVLRRLATL